MISIFSLSARSRLAGWICPEIAERARISQRLEAHVVQALRPLSKETEHVLRLGRILLEATGAKKFHDAAGVDRPARLPSRTGRGLGEFAEGPARNKWGRVSVLYQDWLRISANPPAQIKDSTYREMTIRFSEFWPETVPWPADIPRPQPGTQHETSGENDNEQNNSRARQGL